MTAELRQINEALQILIADQSARIGVTVETGYDELNLVATSDGYLQLAQALVEFVLEAEAQQTESWTKDGLTLPGSSAIRLLFGLNYEVDINSLSLASTQAEVQQAVEYFRRMSPMGNEALPMEELK